MANDILGVVNSALNGSEEVQPHDAKLIVNIINTLTNGIDSDLNIATAIEAEIYENIAKKIGNRDLQNYYTIDPTVDLSLAKETIHDYLITLESTHNKLDFYKNNSLIALSVLLNSDDLNIYLTSKLTLVIPGSEVDLELNKYPNSWVYDGSSYVFTFNPLDSFKIAKDMELEDLLNKVQDVYNTTFTVKYDPFRKLPDSITKQFTNSLSENSDGELVLTSANLDTDLDNFFGADFLNDSADSTAVEDFYHLKSNLKLLENELSIAMPHHIDIVIDNTNSTSITSASDLTNSLVNLWSVTATSYKLTYNSIDVHTDVTATVKDKLVKPFFKDLSVVRGILEMLIKRVYG
jgi:hypothetical protein